MGACRLVGVGERGGLSLSFRHWEFVLNFLRNYGYGESYIPNR